MLMAKIMVTVEVDESKLTAEQQKHAEMSNTDLLLDHPVTLGCETLQAAIELQAAQVFSYLGSGAEAVTTKVED